MSQGDCIGSSRMHGRAAKSQAALRDWKRGLSPGAIVESRSQDGPQAVPQVAVKGCKARGEDARGTSTQREGNLRKGET